MKKKISSLVLAISMLASLFVAMPVSADGGMTISMPEITLNQSQGTETVEVPVVIENNPGVLGVQLQVKYGEGLVLTDVKEGDALSSLAFTAPGNFEANPIKMMWDGQDYTDDTNGVIATLTFTVTTDEIKDYEIEITDAIVVDGDVNSVETTIKNGNVSVIPGEPEKGTTISVSEITVDAGEETELVEVPVSIEENKGVLGVQLRVKYAEGLTLKGVKAGEALKGLTCTVPGDFTANPIKIMWDGQDEPDSSNGIFAVLTFEVPKNKVADYAIEITEAIVVDINIDPVDVTIVDGKIKVTETHEHEYGEWEADGDNHKKECSCGDVVTELHNWGAGVVTVAPTFTTEGVKTYTCVCGEQKTEIIPVLDHEHEWDGGAITKEPTHTVDGVKTYTCTKCGEQKTEVIPAEGHTLTYVEEVSATCIEDGTKAYYICSVCNTKFADEKATTELKDVVIPAKGHTYGDWAEDGEENHKKECSCGNIVTEAHTWDDGVVTQAPTADADGVMAYTCLACKYVRLEVIKKIEGLNIAVSEKTVKKSAGTKIVEVPVEIAGNTGLLGVQLQVKYDEGLVLQDVKAGDALSSLAFTAPGDFTANPIKIMWDGQDEADATNGVIAKLTFAVPGDKIADYKIEITDSIVVDKDINSVEAILQSGKISVVEGEPEPGPAITVSEITVGQGDGAETVEVPIVIEENTGVLGVQLRVKYAEGLTLTDVKAGDALSSLAFTAPGDFTANPIKIMWDGQDAADASNGVIAKLTFEVPKDKANDYTIEITDAIVVDEDVNSVAVIVENGKISVHAHEYGDWEVDGDNHKKECSCGDVITEAHTWDNGVVTTPATCTQVGVKTYTCTACGNVKFEVLPMEQHSYGDWEADGDNHKKECSCGDVITEAHTWDNGVVTTPATCTEDGVKTYTCTVCNATRIETITPPGHADNNNDHNCDVCGEKLTECADNDNDHNCDVCGTKLTECADNNNDHNCDVCGTKLTECADNDNDHNCDACGTKLTECADNNNDHNCDVCGTELTECADNDNDHNCDVCGTKLTECDWDEGVVTQEPTCTQNGVKTYTCACGDTYTEVIPAKGHTYGDWVADGDVHKKECSCGDVVTEAHAWNAGVVTKEPTETQTGIKTYTCTVCNEQKTEIIPVIKPDEPVVTGTTITVSNVTVAQGTGVQEVQVPVVISQNTGILGMTLQVKYAEGLTLTKVTKGDALTTLAFTKPGNLSANPVNMVWDADLFDDDKSNGTIAILTFTVPKENVKDYAVEITTKGAFDDMLDPVNVTTVNGKISVSKTHVHEYGDWIDDGDNHKKVCSCGDVITELHAWDEGVVTKQPAYPQKGEKTYTCTVCGAKKTEAMEWVYNPGDPTDDGEIDTRDIISIRRYIAGGYNVVINLAGADVDKDGMIDSRDIILVRRYLAGGYGVVLK